MHAAARSAAQCVPGARGGVAVLHGLVGGPVQRAPCAAHGVVRGRGVPDQPMRRHHGVHFGVRQAEDHACGLGLDLGLVGERLHGKGKNGSKTLARREARWWNRVFRSGAAEPGQAPLWAGSARGWNALHPTPHPRATWWWASCPRWSRRHGCRGGSLGWGEGAGAAGAGAKGECGQIATPCGSSHDTPGVDSGCAERDDRPIATFCDMG